MFMIAFLCFTKDKTLSVSTCLHRHRPSIEGNTGWSMFQERSCFSKDVKDLLIQYIAWDLISNIIIKKSLKVKIMLANSSC